MMIEFLGLGHINIVTQDIDEAIAYYQELFNARPHQLFRHFKNVGFAKSAGFMEMPDNVDVSIAFLEIPNTSVYIELMEYHNPMGDTLPVNKATNTIGGVGHICIKVRDVSSAFLHIKKMPETKLISSSGSYQPYKIDDITPDDFIFFEHSQECNQKEKAQVCKIINSIKYFYFIDKYGVQWEFEEGHHDIGN